MSKTTIKDVAKKAGVSVTSVSRVLNDRGYISDNLRVNVMNAIEELDYTPNAIARSFFKNETQSIAFIVPTVANPFFSELTFWIEKELAKFGYHLFVGNSMNDPVIEKEYLKMLKEERIDGIIVGSHNMNIEEYDNLDGNIVSIERKLLENIPMIESDNYKGGRMATEELINKGCKNILCVTGNQLVDTPANHRTTAYLDVVHENQLERHVLEIPFTQPEKSKIDIIEQLFSETLKYDGVFAGDDTMAKYFMNAAKKYGVNVPEDLKVVGFDGSNQIQVLVPDLTTIIQPIQKMAVEAVNVLLKQIKNEEVELIYTLPVELKQSETTNG